jgi:hypothetical protein
MCNRLGYPIARRVSNNEETLQQRQQAAERRRLYRGRKRQQQNTTRVTCYTVRGEQVTTAPHTEQREGNAKTTAKYNTCYV